MRRGPLRAAEVASIGVNSRSRNGTKRTIAFCQKLHRSRKLAAGRSAQRDGFRERYEINQSLRRIDAEDFWLRITQVSAELLGAERASILVRNEKSNSLHAKAAIGSRINLLSEPSVGERVATRILEIGDPIVVADIAGIDIESAPPEWSYKTRSFLS